MMPPAGYSLSNMLLQCASSAAQYSLPADSSAWSFFTSNSRRRISLRSFCVSACGAEVRAEGSACGAGMRGAGDVGGADTATVLTATGATAVGDCAGSTCGGAIVVGGSCGDAEGACSRVARGGAGVIIGIGMATAEGTEGAKKSPRTSETPRDTEKGEGETPSSTSGAAAVDFGLIRFFTRVTRSCG